jgi:hypothetical protein
MFFIQSDEVDTFRPRVAMISLNKSDRLRLINFEPEITQIVTETVVKHYQQGIKGPYEYLLDFLLHKP